LAGLSFPQFCGKIKFQSIREISTMPDLELRCVHCQGQFVFSEKEQDAFYRRNMPQPQRCPKCRPTRKKLETGASSGTRHEIVCDRCGRKDSVPFAPKAGRTVMCSECYSATQTRVRSA
jgi:CxxC-x17-CxxC domain-containing protein